MFGATVLGSIALVSGWWPIMLVSGLVFVAVGLRVATDRAGDAQQLDRLATTVGVPVGRAATRAIGTVFALLGVILVAGAIQQVA